MSSRKEFGGRLKQAGGEYRIIATTTDPDRDGEVVVSRGVQNLDRYLKNNPVILWGHRWDEPPVGKATGAELFDDRLELTIEWADTEFGREVKYLFDGGFMSSFSIGFLPRNGEIRGGAWHHTEWDLLEVSAVPIPANEFAVIQRSLQNDNTDSVQLAKVKRLVYQPVAAEAEKPETKSWGEQLADRYLRRKR